MIQHQSSTTPIWRFLKLSIVGIFDSSILMILFVHYREHKFCFFINNIAFLPIRKGFFYVTIHAKIEIHSSWNLGFQMLL